MGIKMQHHCFGLAHGHCQGSCVIIVTQSGKSKWANAVILHDGVEEEHRMMLKSVARSAQMIDLLNDEFLNRRTIISGRLRAVAPFVFVEQQGE